jgi:hypothetical protein
MALTAAREMPARPASSAWDHLRASLCVSTGLKDIFLSFMDIIVSLTGKRNNQKHQLGQHCYCSRNAKRLASQADLINA